MNRSSKKSQPNFKGQNFSSKVDGIQRPTQLPSNEAALASWKSAKKSWGRSVRWLYTPAEWRLKQRIIHVEPIRICVLKNDVIPLPLGPKKAFLERTLPSTVASHDQRCLHMGSLLVAEK
jgi:hypothetical protein